MNEHVAYSAMDYDIVGFDKMNTNTKRIDPSYRYATGKVPGPTVMYSFPLGDKKCETKLRGSQLIPARKLTKYARNCQDG